MDWKYVLIGAAAGLAVAFLLRKTSVSMGATTAQKIRSV